MDQEERLLYEFGPFLLDPTKRLLWKDNELVSLEPKVIKTLVVLVAAKGKLLEKDELVKEIWGDVTVTGDSLHRNIRILRRTLAEAFDGQECIKNIPARGYFFALPVRERWTSTGEATNQGTDGVACPEDGTRVPAASQSAVSKAPQSKLPHPETIRLPSWLRRHRVLSASMFAAIVAGVFAAGSEFVFSGFSPRVLRCDPLTHDRNEKYSLLTDGSHVYFEERLSGKDVIAEVAATGGEVVYFPARLQDFGLVSTFPGGSALLMASGASTAHPSFWKVPLPGGSPQPLENLHTSNVDWSTDGQKVAYTDDEEHKLFVANADGTNPREILSFPKESILSPRWSPDGKMLRFSASDPEIQDTASLWEVSADGSNRHLLIPGWNNPPYEGSGSWTRDGKYYVFCSVRNHRSDIWAIREKKGWFIRMSPKPVRLTDGAMDFCPPVPSPDGKRIFVLGKQEDGELARYDFAAKAFRPYLGGISAGQTEFSCDGQWVTYVTYPEGALWRSRMDGSDKLQLTFAPLEADSPHWSPDGRRIAFRAGLRGQIKKISLISREGGAREELMPEDQSEEGVPTWSPDGNLLAFGELRWSRDKIAIHIIDLRTRRIMRVPGSGGLWTPRWSPDGRHLLALASDAVSGDSNALLIFDFHTQRWKKLVDHSINEPAWSHDSQYIYFDIASPQKAAAIFRVRVNDGRLEQIVSLEDFRRVYSQTFGNWFGLAPDDSPLLVRDTRNTEVYALDVQW